MTCSGVGAQEAMEATLAEHEPAVRRLCIATAAGTPGILAGIQRSEGFYRLYQRSDPSEDVELAFASPGLDEIGLVKDLIAAIHRKVVMATDLHRPVLAGSTSESRRSLETASAAQARTVPVP
jgi:hypothetical protein